MISRLRGTVAARTGAGVVVDVGGVGGVGCNQQFVPAVRATARELKADARGGTGDDCKRPSGCGW